MKANSVHIGINALLSLCCVGLAVFIGWRLFVEPPQQSQPAIQLVQAAPEAGGNLRWRWFDSGGSRNTGAMSQEEAEEEVLAEANINAVLIGVMRTSEFATATISINGQPEKVFSIGDELQSGVELLSVSTSRVILDERGRRVQITMRRPEGMLQQNVQQNTAGNGSVTQLENGFSLANMFDAVPVQVDNGGTGFQLDGISQEMLDLTEIQEGDVVVQVGGMTIDQLMANPGQWMNFSSETTLPVTVMRNGEETTLYVNAFSLSARILPGLTNELMQ